MIKANTTYTITVTEGQLKELYSMLAYEKQMGGAYMSFDKELTYLYNELQNYIKDHL